MPSRKKGGANCCCCSPCSVPPAPEGGEDKTAAQTEKRRAALDHPLLVSTKPSIPSRHVSSLPTFSEIIRSTSCQTRSAVTNGCVCAHACYSHMGAAEISAGGENFFSQGGGLAKKTQGGGLFLKFRVWVGRV